MKLSKFPVITPEGNRYFVTLVEVEEFLFGSLFDKYMKAKIYKERNSPLLGIFRFKHLKNLYLDYDHKNPNYIEVSEVAIQEYENDVRISEQRITDELQSELRRKKAIKDFNEWDGHIS